MSLFAAEEPMQTASPTTRSNILTFPALPARRFGQPRQSSVYRLGGSAARSGDIDQAAFDRGGGHNRGALCGLAAAPFHQGRPARFRRPDRAQRPRLSLALDELVQEIASRKQHWQFTTTHTRNHPHQDDAAPSVAPAN
jgi:hypothetical protein